jgi:hypothetical protein
MKVFTVRNSTEQRNFGNLAYNIKFKWEKPRKDSRTEVGREQELDCM